MYACTQPASPWAYLIGLCFQKSNIELLNQLYIFFHFISFFLKALLSLSERNSLLPCSDCWCYIVCDARAWNVINSTTSWSKLTWPEREWVKKQLHIRNIRIEPVVMLKISANIFKYEIFKSRNSNIGLKILYWSGSDKKRMRPSFLVVFSTQYNSKHQ